MHLSRGYPWNLELSERELTVIEKSLGAEPLSADEADLADNLLFKLRNIHDKVTAQRRQREEGPEHEEDLHEVVGKSNVR